VDAHLNSKPQFWQGNVPKGGPKGPKGGNRVPEVDTKSQEGGTRSPGGRLRSPEGWTQSPKVGGLNPEGHAQGAEGARHEGGPGLTGGQTESQRWTRSPKRFRHEVPGGRMLCPKVGQQSPKVEGRIPKACRQERRADTKGIGTQLGNGKVPGGGHEVQRGPGHVVPRVGCKSPKGRTRSPEGRGSNPKALWQESRGPGHEGDRGLNREGFRDLARTCPGRAQGLTRGFRATVRERAQGPRMGPQGPRGISVQRIRRGECKFYGSQRVQRVMFVAESILSPKATLQKCGSYIGNRDGWDPNTCIYWVIQGGAEGPRVVLQVTVTGTRVVCTRL